MLIWAAKQALTLRWSPVRHREQQRERKREGVRARAHGAATAWAARACRRPPVAVDPAGAARLAKNGQLIDKCCLKAHASHICR